ncbi:hypothetical protein [Herbinix hemicellulosilytica]|uniref:Uncharacterized protein n=1 Tax=Herbinix hemicellulosilytica TaxID=1564487 RepID=A0A0H5SM47_HERHM|nr:hypothetical protein [Herbinix hemicellulosilytica]CRZ35881.1 hypothetical protein HHT355_2700 [Herbinix hemicellulosilytica]
MINLEVFRIELNYLQQVVGKELGNKDARKLSEAITGLVTCFLNPATYYSLSLSYIQIVEQYLCQVQPKTEPYEYKLMLNNIPTIRNFLKKVKLEMSIS